MKPINEIRFRLCFLTSMILLQICRSLYPSGSGWFGLATMVLVCVFGVWLGCFVTNLLIAFKKWIKE